MALIKGIPVILMVKTEIGKDGFDRPIYEEQEVVIDNVLIGEASTEDVTNSLNLYGKRAAYALGIPKGDNHIWQDTSVKFFDQTFRTIGVPVEGIEANIPLDWNKKVMVERYE